MNKYSNGKSDILKTCRKGSASHKSNYVKSGSTRNKRIGISQQVCEILSSSEASKVNSKVNALRDIGVKVSVIGKNDKNRMGYELGVMKDNHPVNFVASVGTNMLPTAKSSKVSVKIAAPFK